MKFLVTYTRTLTHEEEIEAESQDEAQRIADETQERMLGVEYNESDEENEVEPKFLQECQVCHNAESFDDWIYCVACAKDSVPDQLRSYIERANLRMMAETNVCSRCSRSSFRCEYTMSESLGLYILCPRCCTIDVFIKEGSKT